MQSGVEAAARVGDSGCGWRWVAGGHLKKGGPVISVPRLGDGIPAISPEISGRLGAGKKEGRLTSRLGLSARRADAARAVLR